MDRRGHKLRQALLKHAGGERLMAQVLAMVSVAGQGAVLVAAELALEHAGPSGRVSPEHVLNVLARLTAPPRPQNVATALSTLMPPKADTASPSFSTRRCFPANRAICGMQVVD